MNQKGKELGEELKLVLAGKTFDALLPPVLFTILNAIWGLQPASIGAALLALVFFLLRIQRKQDWKYALGGLLAVSLSATLALLTKQASSYFLPGLLSSAVIVLLTSISLFSGKPLAAWASHLTRGWPLEWFWRADVKPAYTEVTMVWLGFFILRLALQAFFYIKANTNSLVWVNSLFGWPLSLIVLILSYLFGIWRLHRLGGPGVDEFIAGSEAPFKGQTRGF